MAGPLGPYPGRLVPGRIVQVRIRLGWNAAPVVQIKRQLSHVTLAGFTTAVAPAFDTTPWRDAAKSDSVELAQFIDALQVKP